MTSPEAFAPVPCLGSGLDPEEELLHAPKAGAHEAVEAELRSGSPDYPPAVLRGAPNSNYTPSNRPVEYPIEYVVIHYTAGMGFPIPYGPGGLAHYGIAQDGRVEQTLPEKHIAWHAGNWAINCRSVGIEHVGYGRPADWTDALLRSSAKLTAAICKKYRIPVDRAHIIGHSEVPGANHTDVGPAFPWARYVALVKEAGGQAPVKPPAPTPGDRPEYVYALAWAAPDVAVAEAAVAAMTLEGYKQALIMRTAGDLAQGSSKALEQPDRPALVIGGPTVPRMAPAARAAFERGDYSRLLDCVGDGLEATIEEVAWRLAALAPRLGVNRAALLRRYRSGIDLRDPHVEPVKPVKPVSRTAAKVAAGKSYGLRIVGARYEWGTMDVTGGRPYWAADEPAPDPATVRASSCLCAGYGNLVQRAAGSYSGQAQLRALEPVLLGQALEAAGLDEHALEPWGPAPQLDRDGAIPRSGQYYGGTLAYWPFFLDASEPFDPDEDYPDMTLLLRKFRAWGTDEGHVAMLTHVGGKKVVMQSYADAYGSTRPGCTVAVPLAASHAGYYYERAVVPGRPGWFD